FLLSFFLLLIHRLPRSPLFPYTTLFRSMVLASVVIGLALTHLLQGAARIVQHPRRYNAYWVHLVWAAYIFEYAALWWWYEFGFRSEEHTSELQSRRDLVCRLLLEKKKKK